jgi:hypothetical protein
VRYGIVRGECDTKCLLCAMQPPVGCANSRARLAWSRLESGDGIQSVRETRQRSVLQVPKDERVRRELTISGLEQRCAVLVQQKQTTRRSTVSASNPRVARSDPKE